MESHRFFILAISLLLALSICSSKEAKNIRRAVFAEVKKYPDLQIQDLYKLAYQAAMGNDNITNDLVAVKKSLTDELAAVDTLSNEPLIEYLTSDSSIARVNLRAMKKQKKNSDKLFAAMVQTASSVQPSTDLLRQFLDDVEALAEDGRIPFKKDELNSYFSTMENQNFPAVNHSKTVDDEYHPAYRIAAGKQISLQ
jgi:hypothetical protein